VVEERRVTWSRADLKRRRTKRKQVWNSLAAAPFLPTESAKNGTLGGGRSRAMAQINYSSLRSTNEAIGRGKPKGKTAEQSGVSVGVDGRASGGASRGRRCAAKRV